MKRFSIVIPARFASTRFPGKPLAMIGSKTMIEHVVAAAKCVSHCDRILVATDSVEIKNLAEKFVEVILTKDSHPSGTDRIAEAVEKANISSEIIVNIQGDEPFIKAEQIENLIQVFDRNEKCEIATVIKKIESETEYQNQNCVKAVIDKFGKALYFSRSPIPFYRENESEKFAYKHLGIYAYQRNTLLQITKLPKSSLENAEMLEQLRWLENGISIYTSITTFQSIAVDTPQDLELANQYWFKQNN